MNTSEKGRAFIRAHEGDVLTCYLDPVGIPTIGVGFTNRTPTVTAMLGRLRPGVTKITREQSDRVFREVLAKDFEPAVQRGMPGAMQHEFDCGASVSWNLGVGAMRWQWAKLWRSGQKRAAAEYLGSNYNTAAGRRLPGLVRRRREEALLLSTGIYTGIDAPGRAQPEGVPRRETPSPPAQPDPMVKEAQDILREKGFDPGESDGWMGPKTKAAIEAYQSMHPHLIVDGILGPATIAQLRRDAQALRDATTKGGGLTSGATILSYLAGLPWGWIAIGVVVLAAGYFAWRYRDVIRRRWNTWRAG